MIFPDRVTSNADLGIIRPSPVAKTKSPGMPRAGHHAILDMAATECRAHVWTKVIDRMKFAAGIEYGDDFHAAIHGFARSIRQILGWANGEPFVHG